MFPCVCVCAFLSVCVHASCINVSDIGWSVGGDAFILTGMRNLKEHYPFKCFLKTRAESLCGGFLGRRRRREPRETRLTRYIWSGSWSDCIFYTHTQIQIISSSHMLPGGVYISVWCVLGKRDTLSGWSCSLPSEGFAILWSNFYWRVSDFGDCSSTRPGGNLRSMHFFMAFRAV